MGKTPDPIVSITQYAVSLLPADDVNYKSYVILVERDHQSDCWIIHNGHEYYTDQGTWDPTRWKADHFSDPVAALKIAKDLAPGITVNGRTATEAHRLTQT